MEEYGDTDYDPTEDSQASEYEDGHASSGDIDDFQPEMAEDGTPQPVPYDRFKQSRSQLRDSRDELGQLQGQFDAMQAKQSELQNYSQWAYSQLKSQQAQQTQEEIDEFADPLERRVMAMERTIQQQNQQLMASKSASEQRQIGAMQDKIRAEIDKARDQYKWLDERDVLHGLAVNPGASVMELAKRSHKEAERQVYERAPRMGLRPKARQLQRFGVKGPVSSVEIGDDLELAEAAAIDYLQNLGD